MLIKAAFIWSKSKIVKYYSNLIYLLIYYNLNIIYFNICDTGPQNQS